VFRCFKSDLGFRPIFHHKEERADSHLFITVLAYQFVQLIRRRLKERDSHANSSWRTLREIMRTQCRVTASFRRADEKRCIFAKPPVRNRSKWLFIVL
jgi:transposase